MVKSFPKKAQITVEEIRVNLRNLWQKSNCDKEAALMSCFPQIAQMIAEDMSVNPRNLREKPRIYDLETSQIIHFSQITQMISLAICQIRESEGKNNE